MVKSLALRWRDGNVFLLYTARLMTLEKQGILWGQQMAAAQDGDEKAYRALLRGVQPLLANFIRKRVPDALTDDIVQEVLIGLHKVRHTYDPKQPFLPWMFAIARYKIIDALRKNGRKIAKEAVSLDEIETFIGDETNNSYEKSDVQRELVTAMNDTLTDKQKAIVGLMKVEGLTAQEVADKTGMSVANVKVTAHRAYKKLKERLGSK